MSKKTFYIILITITLLTAIGWLAWYLFLSPVKAPAPVGGVSFTVPDQNAGGSNLQAISEGPIVSFHQKSDGTILFYDLSGQLWQLNKGDSKPVLLNQTPIGNAAVVIWSANNKNIVKLGTGQTDSSYVLSDPDKKSLFNLNAGAKSAVFSPDGKKFIYQVVPDSKTDNLIVGDSSGKNQKTLMSNLSLRDIILIWPSADNIALVSKPSGAVAGNLWFLDIRNLSISKIIDSFFGLEVLFSPDGKSFIYSYTNQNGLNLNLGIYKNGNQKIINKVSTLVDKCAWTKDSISIYCAVPKSWSDSALLPDDYYKNAFSTADDIWKINSITEEKTLVSENTGDVSNLAVSDDESGLFFISKENQLLYKLIITKQ